MRFEDILDKEGTLVYKNVGVSMMPLIKEGRDILVIGKKDRSLEENDVVLFVRKNVEGRGHYVLHRILKILPDDRYWIVGDNCIGGETIKEEDIIGILNEVIRKGKKVGMSDLSYRLYVALYCRPYRIRFLFLRGKHLLYRILHKIKRTLFPLRER